MWLSDSGVTITISSDTSAGYVGEIRDTTIGCALLLAIGNIRFTNIKEDIEYTDIGYTAHNLVDATYYSHVELSNKPFKQVEAIVIGEITEIMSYVENY